VPVLKEELPESLSPDCYERLLDGDPAGVERVGDRDREPQVHPDAPLHRRGQRCSAPDSSGRARSAIGAAGGQAREDGDGREEGG